MSQDGAFLFFQLISALRERAPTALTSNKGFEEWGSVLGDEVMAAALIDRPQHHGHIVTSGATATACGRIRICCAALSRRVHPGRVLHYWTFERRRALRPGLGPLRSLRPGRNDGPTSM